LSIRVGIISLGNHPTFIYNVAVGRTEPFHWKGVTTMSRIRGSVFC